MKPGGGGCSEPRSCHCTPAWATKVKLHLKNKIKNKNDFPFSPSPPSPGDHYSTSFSVNLTTIEISYTWNHTVPFLNCSLLFSERSSMTHMHIVACVKFSSLLRLNNIHCNYLSHFVYYGLGLFLPFGYYE